MVPFTFGSSDGRSTNGTTQRIATGTFIKPIGARAVGKVVNDDRADWREAWALFPGSVAYIWHAGTKAGIVQDSLAACGFETRSQIIWAKNNFAIGRGQRRSLRTGAPAAMRSISSPR